VIRQIRNVFKLLPYAIQKGEKFRKRGALGHRNAGLSYGGDRREKRDLKKGELRQFQSWEKDERDADEMESLLINLRTGAAANGGGGVKKKQSGMLHQPKTKSEQV